MSAGFPKDISEQRLEQAVRSLTEGLSPAAPDPVPNSATSRGGRRILSLWLPRFSMDRWLITAARQGDAPPDDLPLVLAVDKPQGAQVHATSRAAEQAGVQIGARVVDMRALCPQLRVDYADLPGDRAALHQLMLWLRRWSPWSAVDGADGILLDTTGCDHLFGGEAAMLTDIEGRLACLGLSSCAAIAPTTGAAWALARYGGVRPVCADPDLHAAIAPLPVRALRIGADASVLLNRLGLKTIGDLIAVPRLSLARRFARTPLADNPLMRLDQMMGRLAEPLEAPDDPPRFCVDARLPEPVQDPADWLPELAAQLCADLETAGLGARRLTVTVFRTDGMVSAATVAVSLPSRDARHLVRLFEGKLDQIDPGYGFDLITLAAPVVERMDRTQHRLDGKVEDGTELAELVDRLSAKFGRSAILRPAPVARHIPERAEDWRPALAGEPAVAPLIALRPLRMLDHPEEVRVLYAVPEGPPAQFVWRRQVHRVSRFAGPERIAPEWWADRPGTRLRDYYRVEDQHGLRLWIYREGVLGDGRGSEPRWFLHGMFP